MAQMDNVVSQDVIKILTYLLPGFLAAEVVYTLTPSPRRIPFERVIQALIFTVVVQAAASGLGTTLLWIGDRGVTFGEWNDRSALLWSVALAVLLAVAIAWALNTDAVHSLLRATRITYQTSFSSEWFGALCQHRGYVVLHLEGSRRMYGWPEEWPNQPDSGHFVIAEAEWLDGDNRIPLLGVRRVLVPAKTVEMLELMEVVTAGAVAIHGGHDGRQEAADAVPEGTRSEGH